MERDVNIWTKVSFCVNIVKEVITMPSYFSMGTKSSESVSQRYLQINNCGFCESLDKTTVSRPNGRMDYQLIYVKSGRMVFEINGQKQHIDEGHVFLYRPNVPQYYRIDGVTTTFFWIHFSGTAVEDMLSALSDGCIKTGELPEFERYCRALYMGHQLIERFNPLYYEGELISLFAIIADKSANTVYPAQNYDKISQALLAMNRSLSPRLSNDQLAQLCGLNKHYFIKLFKRATGMSPQQYYATLIVDEGRSLLETTDYSVSEIAGLCGVEDSFYFSRLFKKHTGISPAGYRTLSCR